MSLYIFIFTVNLFVPQKRYTVDRSVAKKMDPTPSSHCIIFLHTVIMSNEKVINNKVVDLFFYTIYIYTFSSVKFIHKSYGFLRISWQIRKKIERKNDEIKHTSNVMILFPKSL